jgi:transcriptional regulator with XRE-family HTH domain
MIGRVQAVIMSLADEIKKAMEKQGITSYRVWKDTGIDQSSMSGFFSGTRALSVERLDKLLDYLGYEMTIRKKAPQKGKSKHQ